MTPLDKIVESKLPEIHTLKARSDSDPTQALKMLLKEGRKPKYLFQSALKRSGLSVIAEIKRKSPAHGAINLEVDVVKQAHQYSKGGAAAISVLTERPFFGGSEEDLIEVLKALEARHPCPVLRKDFILDPLQVAQTALLGAHGILLIVAILKEQTGDFIELSLKLGLDPLVEVHDFEDLHIALKAKAPIIGINRRNLKTMKIDPLLHYEIKKEIPKGIITVAESGIHTVKEAHELYKNGYDAILVGEMLMKSEDPMATIAQMSNG